jgi:hypothetical protein
MLKWHGRGRIEVRDLVPISSDSSLFRSAQLDVGVPRYLEHVTVYRRSQRLRVGTVKQLNVYRDIGLARPHASNLDTDLP